MRIAALFVGLGVLTACTGDGTSPDAQPDPLVNPPPYNDACDGFEGTAIPGAMRWFTGYYEWDGDRVEGIEYMSHIANDAWIDTGEGWDCNIAFNINGNLIDPVNCSTCDYALEIRGVLNEDLSDCFAGLIAADGASFDETYNVTLSNGGARFEFATSGNQLAVGVATNNSAAWESDPACAFF